MQNPLSRRQFLAAGALAALGANAPAQKGPLQPIIDTHVHFYDPSRPGGVPWPPPGDAVLYSTHLPAQFRAATKNLNVTGVVVIEANALPADNRWVLEQVAADPMVVGYIGRLIPGEPDFAANFNQYVKNPIFRGLRLREDMLVQGRGKPAFEKDLQHLAEHLLTVDIVGSVSVLAHIPRLVKLAPRLQFVIDHLPFPEWDHNPAAMLEALRDVAALPNVYAKISSVLRREAGHLITDPAYYRPQLDALWELFSEDRVIYGSNWPVSDLTAPYASVHQVVANYVNARDARAANKFFCQNSIAAYRWRPRSKS